MIFLTFFSALLLSGVAEYYSVVGLASIFPGSFWPVVLMGSVLGLAKLVSISWVYNNWYTAPRILKYYLTCAVVILMMITSMGIFGYLSKAHLEHSSDIAPLVDKIAMLDEKIKTEKENIDGNRKSLKQLDEGVDQIMGRSTDEKGADKAIAIRKAQAKDRSRISQEITESQKSIDALKGERAPISVALQKAESDFGPIKYVAELVYGSGEKDLIDKAVRLVIMLIMVVFDPLAVLLLVAANISLKEYKEEIEDEIGIRNFFKKSKESAKKLDESLVEVERENIVEIEPEIEPEYELEKVHLASGKYEERMVPKKLEPKYDYEEPFAFKEKPVDAVKF